MDVRHHARRDTGAPGYDADLDELLGTSDAVSLHVPLTEATRHLLDARRLGLLPAGRDPDQHRPRARSSTRRPSSRRCVAGRLGGAGLDVFDDEPNVSRRLLARAERRPHAAHRQRHVGARDSPMCEMAVDAVVEVLAGRAVPQRRR